MESFSLGSFWLVFPLLVIVWCWVSVEKSTFENSKHLRGTPHSLGAHSLCRLVQFRPVCAAPNQRYLLCVDVVLVKENGRWSFNPAPNVGVR